MKLCEALLYSSRLFLMVQNAPLRPSSSRERERPDEKGVHS
jgi:hypothetical protein